MNNILEVKNLTKNYGKSRGVSDVNLEIEKGTIYGKVAIILTGKDCSECWVEAINIENVNPHNIMTKHLSYVVCSLFLFPITHMEKIIYNE